MAQVVINPSWGVPPTILKNDVLPGIQKSGSQYMAKKGLKAYDKDGRQVNVATINARNYRRYNYKQAPGHDNSLGYVKFNMPNKWDIYLHDTPHREDFAKRERALSSGCIRVHNPMEMAQYILATIEGKQQYTAGKLDSMTSTRRTRWEPLKHKIPVCITYLTAFPDTTATHIRFVRDVYRRDDKLIAMMK
jgi:murein L,D-transpeptidase YcbB/YkuD